MLVTLLPTIALIKFGLLLNAEMSMSVTLSGMLMLVRPQPLKACVPMLVTLVPITTLVKAESLLNALPGTLVAPFPMMALVK